jgi:competence protein ComEC
MNGKGWAIACLAYLIGLLSTGLINFSSQAAVWQQWEVIALAWAVIGVIAGGILPRFWWRGPRLPVWIAAGCIAALAVTHLQLRIPQPGANDISLLVPQLEDAAMVRGKILEMPRLNRKQKVRFLLKAETVNQEAVSGKLYVTLPLLQGTGLAPNQSVEIVGNLYEPQAPDNPGGFDFQAYLARQGAFAGLSGSLAKEPTQPPWGWWQLRQRIVRAQVKGLGSPTGQLVSSMVLGRRAVDLPYDVQDRFVEAGLAHVLAASGFHVSLLLGMVLTLTRRLDSRSRLIIGLAILLVYVGLTGMQPSVMRAALMGVGVLIALVTERRTKPLGLLLLVATILLLINPLWIWDLGFQLSFLATLGLIVTVPTVMKGLDWLPPAIATLIAVPLAASLWTLPLIIYTFNVVAVYSLLVNVVVTPLVTVVSLGGMVMSAVAAIWPDGGSAIAVLMYYPARLLMGLVTFFTELPASAWAVGKISTAQLLSVYGAILAVWLMPWFKRGWRWLWVALVIVVLVVLPIRYQQATLVQVTVLATESEPVVVVQDRGKVTLINCGDRDTVSYTVLPFLRSQGANRIDLAIATASQDEAEQAWNAIFDALKVKTFLTTSKTLNSRAGAPNPSRYQAIAVNQAAKIGAVSVLALSLDPIALTLQIDDFTGLIANEAVLRSPQLSQWLTTRQNVTWIATEEPKSIEFPLTAAIAPSLSPQLLKQAQSNSFPFYLTEQAGAIQWTQPQSFRTSLSSSEADASLF